MKKFDYCVFIGRFSIFHKGHEAILKHALSIADKVVVVIGSAGSARTVRNPWTAIEREDMIRSSMADDQQNIIFLHMKDYTYNDNMWVSVLQEKVNSVTKHSENIALIGFASDETSYYLKLFPQFSYIEHGTKYAFHATNIRELYFSKDSDVAPYHAMVPDAVISFLKTFRTTEDFITIRQEQEYIEKYKRSWLFAPFPPIFVTVDNLVLKSGHLLLIKRGHNPGKGLFALPGGFVNPKEKLIEAALRELKEETKIKINIPDLKKSITDSKVFDDPMRSNRGRVISHTYLIDLGSGPLPQIKASDDAADAMWIPLNDYYTMEDKFFEDHFHIIRNMISKY